MPALLTTLLALLLALSAQGADINIDGDIASVNAALATYNEADTLIIRTGIWTQASSWVLPSGKSPTIRGMGISNTFITVASTSQPINNTSPSTKPILYADMTLIGNNATATISVGKNIPATPPYGAGFRLYRIYFKVYGRSGTQLGTGGANGLVDSCTFELPDDRTGSSWNAIVTYGNQYPSWESANPLGTTNNVVYENNTFIKNYHANNGNGWNDSYEGAQHVMRFNLFDGGANNGAHGYDSGITGTRTGEVYNNIYTNLSDFSPTSVNGWRSGCFIFASNTISFTSGIQGQYLAGLQLYRGCEGIVNIISNWANIPQILYYSSNPSDNQTLTAITPNTYRFKNTLAIAGDVKIGSTVADTVSNLVMAINKDPAGSGTAYHANTIRNWNLLVNAYDVSGSPCTITLTNILDGTNAFSWPAAMQNGTIGYTQFTNSPVVLYPCYNWENYYNGVKGGFQIFYNAESCNGHNYINDLLQDGRDYFDDTTVNWAGPPAYTFLPYPHPWITPSSPSYDPRLVPVDYTWTISANVTGATLATTGDLFTGSQLITTSGSRTYPRGAEISFSANPISGYDFVRWTKDSVEVSTSTNYSTLATTDGSTLVAEYISTSTPASVTISGQATITGRVTLQ